MNPSDPEEVLRSFALFRELSPALLHDVAGCISVREVCAGEVVLRQGDPGDAIFLVVTGTLEAQVVDHAHATTVAWPIEHGQLVGEIQLVAGGRRTATVVAKTDALLYRLLYADFDRLIRPYPEAYERICNTVQKRLRETELGKLLPKLLGTEDHAAHEEFARRAEWLDVAAGTTLCEAGTPGDELYLVINGRFRIVEQGAAPSEAGRGDLLGEFGVLSDHPRRGNVVAVRDSEVVRLRRRDFEALTEQRPATCRSILRALVERQTRPAACRTLLLLERARSPHGREAADALVSALKRVVPTLVVDLDAIDDLVATRAGDQLFSHQLTWRRFLIWLETKDSAYSFVVMRCRSAAASLSHALGQADHVALLADAGEPIDLTGVPLLPGTLAQRPEQSLVFCHPQHGTALGTRGWLTDPRIDNHYHVRHQTGADFARLARILTRRHVGLVLGGGGARGWAHIGVLRALEELDIPVDMIGGTSMGAVIGAMFAQGMRISDMIAHNRQLIALAPFKEYTVPTVALLAGRKVRMIAEMSFGGREIEDLWIPYYCMSSDLTNATEVVHRSGLLTTATCASGAIPGALPPVLEDGRVLADGGLMNNLPVDVMHSLSPEVVIAVDVSPENEQAFRNASLASPRGFMSKALGQTREASPGLTIVDLLLRATTLQSTRRARECQKLAEYYLRPDVGAFGIMQWEAIDALMDIGYRHALERLRDWHSQPAPPAYASYRPSFFSVPPKGQGGGHDPRQDPNDGR